MKATPGCFHLVRITLRMIKKYQSLWRVKATVVPVVSTTLGTVKLKLQKENKKQHNIMQQLHFSLEVISCFTKEKLKTLTN